MISTQLFETPLIRLDAIDPEKDAAIETSWTYDLDYAQEIRNTPASPISSSELKKHYEKLEKKTEGAPGQMLFAIRSKESEALISMLRINFISWSNGMCLFYLSFGDMEKLQQYGKVALELSLRYFFEEMNLHRATTITSEHRTSMINLLEKSGFSLEVRRRQSIFRNGRLWDSLTFGLLRREWENQLKEAVR
jgi:RimJ/RimL family protein N-acetyltransferase